MRKLAVAAICLSLALVAGGPSRAEEFTPLPPTPQAPGAETPSAVRNVRVLDLGSLPPQLRVQVNALVSQASEDDLQELRGAIDATPMAALALKAKGMSSTEIIAATLDDEGGLTLIARELI